MSNKQVYECIEYDLHTQTCTNWQPVTESNQQPLTKNDINVLTVAIFSFMVVVWVFKQIKHSIMEFLK